MLTLNLNPIFKIRNIQKPYSYLVAHGFSRHTASNLLQSNVQSLRLKHIEHLCKILLCEPNDLFLFTPQPQHNYPSNFPLNKLQTQDNLNLQATLTQTPLSQLKAIAQTILQKEK